WAGTSGPPRPSCHSCADTCSITRTRIAPARPSRSPRSGRAGGHEADRAVRRGNRVLRHRWRRAGPGSVARDDDGRLAVGRADHRCVAPALPLGAHRLPAPPGADLSLPGIARLVEEFLDRLDLHDVTLVGNDTGGALVQLVICGGTERVARAVLASCEAFDNL